MEINEVLGNCLDRIEKQEKHKHYEHTVKLANDYRALVTGVGLEDFLRRLKKRESDNDFIARKELTEFINKSVGESLIKPIKKLMRLTNVHSMIKYKDGSDNEIADVFIKFASIKGEDDVENYIEEELIIQSIIDPNSFVIMDKYIGVDGEDYPEVQEIPSENVFYYSYKHGRLECLVVQTKNHLDKAVYHIYEADNIIVLEELEDKDGDSIKEEIENGFKYKIGKKVYSLEIFNHGLNMIPAFRVGFKSDIRTNRETKESFIDPAVPYLKKLVASVSEFDLANAKHAFPRVFAYEQRCPGTPEKNEICHNGKIKTKNSVCDRCGGSGVLIPESSLDSIIMAIPKNREDFIDLSKMMHTESTDIELLNYMKETIKDYVSQAEKSIYGTNTIVSDSMVKTATENIFDNEKRSDALQPFAKNISKWWVKIHEKGLMLLGKDDGAIVEHRYPRNLKMQSVSDMIQEIKMLKEGGADNVFVDAVQDEIAEKRFVDKPNALKRYKVYKEHKPFNGDSEVTVQYKISNGLVRKSDEVLWANFIDIMDKAEKSVVGDVQFIDLPFEKREELVSSVLDIYVNNLNTFDSLLGSIDEEE